MQFVVYLLIAGVVWLEMQFVHISSWRFVLNNSEGELFVIHSKLELNL